MKEIIRKEIKIVKAIDLINKIKTEPEPKYLWKGIPEGSIGLIAGVAKTGKTTFAENLAISLSIGKKEFFGYKMDGIPRKVLFINLEESYKLRSRRNRNQVSKLSRDEFELFCKNYISTPDEFPTFLNKEEDWIILKDYINASEAEIVFIDSLSHMLVGEIEKSSVAQQFIQTFKAYLGSLNKTIIVVHHNVKGNDRPSDQDHIAGSRFILQNFEFALSLSNIPTQIGGNYACMVYNKHIEKDDTTAYLYRMSNNGWVELLGTDNKFNLYRSNKFKADTENRIDGREDATNRNLLYNYMLSQYNQGSTDISTGELKGIFVKNKPSAMSNDTFHKAINKLVDIGKVKKDGKGIYNVTINEDGEKEK